MLNSLAVFRANIHEATALNAVHEYLENTIAAPVSFDDLFRSKLVYSVSAFDKLIHDLIRIGMVEIFRGSRPPTSKYLAEPIALSMFNELHLATTPPAEYIFERTIMKKLKTLSFQDPDKLADGLSYIWPENQKWASIASALGLDYNTARTTLRLIADRRNCIVHEADMDPLTNQRYPITKSECDDVTNFLLRTGQAIVGLVT